MKTVLASRYSWAIVAVVFIVLLWFSLYYLWLTPLQQQADQLQIQVQQEKKRLAIIQQGSEDKKQTSQVNTTKLQMALPVKPLEDQFLLTLQKAEVKSNSKIVSINVSEAKSIDAGKSMVQSQTEGNYAGEVKPDAIKMLQFTLSMKSPSYAHMKRFIEELETQDRVASVESFSFSSSAEANQVNSGQALSYSLVVSIYFAPQLTELLKDVPIIEYPDPSGKENPLYQNGAY